VAHASTPLSNKWARLLDVYADIEADEYWDAIRAPAGIQLVRGDGPVSAEVARVFIVGEAPGATENGAGRPFVGKAGQILNQCLEIAGWERTQVFITNVIKYRPPNNRTPFLPEVFHAQDSLRREWSIISPTLTVALGATARHALGVSWNPPHGGLTSFGSGSLVCMYHPAFGFRSDKAKAWIEQEWERLADNLQYARKTWEDWDV
jgi:uracil-DNA glycosylase family 4